MTLLHPLPVAAPPVAVAPAVAARPLYDERLKTSMFIDQADDSYYLPLSGEVVNRYRAVYVDKMGGDPDQHVRPTSEQLGGLVAKLSRGKAPYVDLGLFGPHGGRTHRLRKFSTHVIIDGEMTSKQVEAPRTYEAWLASWDVFRAAMIMLDGSSIAPLDAYA